MKTAAQLARAVSSAAQMKAHGVRCRNKDEARRDDIIELADLVEQLAEVVVGLADTVAANPPR